MKKLIIEVGSTSTKIDEYDGENVNHLETYCIFFKKNFKKANKLEEADIKKLIDKVLEMKKKYENIYICGTSVFRMLTDEDKKVFLDRFKNETGFDFEIISQEQENELTVLGATQHVKGKVAVFIGGGGSTEIAIYDNGIKQMVNTKMGVVDVMNTFPDLFNDLPDTKLEVVKKYIEERLNIPDVNVDIMILAGGGHKYFALNSGFEYQENNLYNDKLEPIMMDMKTRIRDTNRYYTEISMDEIKSRVDDPDWWYATRAMAACTLVVAEKMNVKYIVPTDISMVYGLLDK